MKNLKSFLQSCNKSLINQACSGPYWENISPRSFLYGPRCARSVLSRPRADILPVRPSRLVNKIYVSLANVLEETKWLQNGAEPWNKGFWKERMRKLQMYNISRHNVNTTWKKYYLSFTLFIIHLATPIYITYLRTRLHSQPHHGFAKGYSIYWPIKSLTRVFEFSTDQIDHLTLKMASAQLVETSVANNRPSQDSSHPDDLFQSRYVSPRFTPSS